MWVHNRKELNYKQRARRSGRKQRGSKQHGKAPSLNSNDFMEVDIRFGQKKNASCTESSMGRKKQRVLDAMVVSVLENLAAVAGQREQ